MPAPKLQSVEAAQAAISKMLESMSSPSSYGFTHMALDHATTKVLSVERSDDGKTSKVVIEMQVSTSLGGQ